MGLTIDNPPSARPSRVRSTEPKPIGVFLQGGAGDLDREAGNWPVANFDMARRSGCKATTTASSSAAAPTTSSMAAPSSPKRCAGSGASRNDIWAELFVGFAE